MSTTMMPIAVVGMGCRFSGASSNPEAFWEVISNARSGYSKVPAERFNVDSFQHPTNKLNTATAQGAHFLSGNVAAFDAPFFNIAPSDAKAMDPQQRMLLEVVYEGLENAGLRMEALAGSDTGCYVGAFTRDWTDLLIRDSEAAPKYSATGIGSGMLANRVSWFYDWRGPSLTLDTACSSSLVALHLACQAIRNGESTVAIAAGTALILNPDMPLWMSNMNFLSKDGLSKSFDASADGYGRGEGVAAVILKSLDAAIRDQDCIRAVIRGTGVNQDGHTSGITLPSPASQADLIRTVYERAHLTYDDTMYFEAHGTGTKAGDAVETQAIAKTITAHRNPEKKLYIGSVKSNIGHTEGAAGMAGLIKTVLALEKGTIPPNIHFETPNPKIPFDKWSLKVPTSNIIWPSSGLRRASINSFGYGGTNAHVIVDDAASYLRNLGIRGLHNTVDLSDSSSSAGSFSTDSGVLVDSEYFTSFPFPPIDSPHHRLFVFSAHEEPVVLSLKNSYKAHLENRLLNQEHAASDQQYLERLATTLSLRRSVLPWKSFVVADTLEGMVESLGARDDLRPVRSITKPRVAFVFTGQGAQWAGMGQELLSYPIFRRSVVDAEQYLKSSLDCSWSVVEELTRDAKSSGLHLAKFAQPLSTILQIALVELLQSWGIEPVAVVGHSSGEISAAVCAGLISREEGWKVAYLRGKLSSEMAIQYPELKGSMLAAGISASQAQEYISQVIRGRVQVACSNSPESVTISGDETGIDEIDQILKSHGLFSRKLRVENAYHSYHMTRIADAYLEGITDCTGSNVSSTKNIKMVSSVTGKTLDTQSLRPSYWVDNLTSPVQFTDALAALLKGESRRRRRGPESAVDFLLEVGPHAALQGPVKQILTAEGVKNVTYASLLKRGKDAVKTSVEAAGTLFVHGLDVDINAVNRTGHNIAQTPIVDLPTYPWNHEKSYWSESRVSKAHRFREHNRVDLLGAPVADIIEGDPAWRNFLRTSEMPWIRDHKIQSSILYPGAGMICMVIEAARQIADPSRDLDHVELRDVRLDRPMIIPEDDAGIETKLQLLQPKNNSILKEWYEFKISSSSNAERLQTNCSGYVALRYKPTTPEQSSLREKKLAAEKFANELHVRERNYTAQVNKAQFYSRTETLGLQYGPAFQNLSNIRYSKDTASGTVVVHDTRSLMPLKHEDSHLMHPSTLDCMIQLLFAALGIDSASLGSAAVPIFVENLKISTDCPREAGQGLRGYVDVSASRKSEYTADIIFGDEKGHGPQVEITGIRCKTIGSDSVANSADKTVKERYGMLEMAPDLRFGTNSALVKYLDKKEEKKDKDSLGGYLAHVLEALIHAEPHTNILEITDGVSSVSEQALLQLSVTTKHAIQSTSWTVANLSAEAQELLAKKTGDTGAKLTFESLEVDRDAFDQSTSQSNYDIVLISGQRASKIDAAFLNYVGNLLRSEGRLILVPGSGSNEFPNELFVEAAFERLIQIPSTEKLENGAQFSSVLIASRIQRHELVQAGQLVSLVLPETPSERCLLLANELTQLLKSNNLTVRSRYWNGDLEDVCDTSCISLLEIDGFISPEAGSAQFDATKSLVLRTQRLFWVAGSSDPRAGVMTGLFRTVRNENPNLDLVSLGLGETALKEIQQTASLIVDSFLLESAETELFLEDGLCFSSRYAPVVPLNFNVAIQQDKTSSELMTIGEASVPLQLDIQNVGQLDTTYFKTDHQPETDLLSDEVELESRAIGVNSHDIMTLTGQLASPFLGRESSGVITRVGSAVSKFKPGDRIYQVSPGSFKTSIRTKEAFCQHIPSGMTFAEAASVPVAFITALHCLRDLARVQAGERVLIHAAAGGIGQAAIQLAKHYQAEIFVTVGSAAKSQMLQDVYGIPEDHIFSSRDASFVDGIKRGTNGRGVDVVLNSLTGELLRQTWYCVAPFGRFIEIGTKDIDEHASLDMTPFRQSITFASFNLNLILTQFQAKLSCLIRDVATLINGTIINPVHSVTKFTATELHSALRYVQAGQHMGKVVVTVDRNDKIPVHPTTRNMLRLRSDRSYLLVGGLGGLGRSAAIHLAQCGAKHLSFVSRSGPSDPKAEPLGQELKQYGARASFFSCDVANTEQLRSVIERHGGKALPPIAGCIQGAMVLRDGIFENMTHDDFKTSLLPKVKGSWNLHEILPRDLDFFIMWSSISGVTGNPGQANYAAGNTYMDQLAHYRRRQGLPATSLDLGLMLDVGFVAERQGVSNLKKWESMGLREAEFLLIMSAAMRGTLPAPAESEQPYQVPAQIVTGLATGGHVAANSLDAPFYFQDPRFKQLVRAELSGAASGDAAGDSEILRSSLKVTTSAAQAQEVISEALCGRLARVMDTAPENIEVGKPLHAYGVDSLMAVDMRNWIVKEMRCEISLFDVLSSPSIADLASKIVGASKLVPKYADVE